MSPQGLSKGQNNPNKARITVSQDADAPKFISGLITDLPQLAKAQNCIPKIRLETLQKQLLSEAFVYQDGRYHLNLSLGTNPIKIDNLQVTPVCQNTQVNLFGISYPLKKHNLSQERSLKINFVKSGSQKRNQQTSEIEQINPEQSDSIHTSFTGYVFDDDGKPIADAQVKLKAFEPDLELEQITSTDSDGYYSLKNILSKTPFILRVHKKGYSPRSLIKELLPQSADQIPQRQDFGIDTLNAIKTPTSLYGGHQSNALSTRPEIIHTSPKDQESFISAYDVLHLVFSEAIATSELENSLCITRHEQNKSPLIFLAQDLDFHWNTAQSEVWITAAKGQVLPARQTKQVYEISFCKPIPFSDRAGNQADQVPFRLRQEAQKNIQFFVLPDQDAPWLQAIRWEWKTDHALITVVFSEVMRWSNQSEDLMAGITPEQKKHAPGPYKDIIDAKTAAQNYQIRFDGQNYHNLSEMGRLQWGATYRQLEITLPFAAIPAEPNWFYFRCTEQVSDPAGNKINPEHRQLFLQLPTNHLSREHFSVKPEDKPVWPEAFYPPEKAPD